MNNTQRVLKNTSYLTIAEIFAKVIGFMWVIFLARSLSVELYGRYTFVNAFIALFAIFPDLGVGLVAIREIAKHPQKAAQYVSQTVIINLILALITIISIIITSTLFRHTYDIRILIMIASLSLFFSSLRIAGIIYFEAREKMKQVAILNILNISLSLGAGIIGFSIEGTLTGIFTGMLLGSLLSLVVTWSVMRSYIRLSLKLDTKLAKKLLCAGLPLGLAAFSYMVYTRIDSIILNSLLGVRAVGHYNAATPFVFALIQLLNVPFAASVYPTLSRLYKEDKRRFVKSIKKSLTYVFSWSFPTAIAISLLAPFIIPMVFGEKYVASIPILRIIIFFVPFASLSALLYKMLIILNKQNIYLLVSLFGVGINIMLNYVLIPQFGIIGAAYASVTTQIALFVIYMYVVTRHTAKL